MSFFGSLFQPITSLFTAPGTSANNKQQAGYQEFQDIAGGVGKDAGKTWADWLKYNRQYTPQLQAGIADAANNLSASGRFNSAVRGGNFARAQAQSQSTPLAYASNPLLAQAYQGQQLNKANDYQNASIQRSQSPEAATQAWQQLLSMLNGAQNNAYQPFHQAAGIMYGAPRAKVGKGFMDYLAPIIGAAAGGASAKGGSETQGKKGGSETQGKKGGNGTTQTQDGTNADQWGNPTPYDWMNDIDWSK